MALLYGVTGTTILAEIGDCDRPRMAKASRPPGRRDDASYRRLRLQDGHRPLPDVGARCLPGRADAGRRLPLRRLEGRRVRRRHPHLLRSPRRGLPQRRLVDDLRGSRRRLDDDRQRHGRRPDRHQADARLLVHRPGRQLPDRPRRHLGHRRRVHPRRKRRAAASSQPTHSRTSARSSPSSPSPSASAATRSRTTPACGSVSPFLALGLAFCLVSLTGIPPTVGFWAKLYIFNAGIRADLALAGRSSACSTASSPAYYYLSVVRQMFLGEARRKPAIQHLAVDCRGAWRGLAGRARFRHHPDAPHVGRPRRRRDLRAAEMIPSTSYLISLELEVDAARARHRCAPRPRRSA